MAKSQKNKHTALASARHAPHKHHGRKFLQVYAPYIPLLLILGVGFSLSFGWHPVKLSGSVGRRVLAYASEMSISALLQGTNNQRAANGLSALTINSKLNTSAQNKADDMVTRDYWSHNTPDGQEPWIFFDAAGYDYQKAGENLAYGFATSNDAIAGWMASPGHKANILDTSYQEVGFGFKNSANYVGNGNETVVVAHYAKPLNGSSTPPAPAPASQPAPAAAGASKTTASPAPVTPTPTPEAEKPGETNTVVETPKAADLPVTSASPVQANTASVKVSGLQTLLGGKAPWIGAALSVVTVMAVAVWVGKHALVVRRMIRGGERYVIHHPVIDVTIIAFLALVAILTRTAGVIK